MSDFIVSARKYRPATFDEVVGQNHISKTLKNALQSEQLAHSFLFCGPRGVGKTTSARILAKVINCENPKDKVEPCNTCSSCQSFNDNASFNIIELDAASNNSVEHMRTLIEQVRFQPQHGTHKVFIIDEVHMLSTQAFNAFLKTLEEPPSYAIFILATTEKHKILPTILSRCQIFDFKRIQPDQVIEQLEHILTTEGKTADKEALHLIGLKADGAMRDALSIYDKIASASGTHISYKDVITNLNILDYDYFFKIVDAVLKEDLSNALILIDEIIKQGFEVDQCVNGLSQHIRDLIIAKDSKTHSLLDVSDDLKQRYIVQSTIADKNFLLSSLDLLNQCDINLPRANNKRLYLEVAISKMAYIHRRMVEGPEMHSKKKILSSDPEPSKPVIQEKKPEIPQSEEPQKIEPKADQTPVQQVPTPRPQEVQAPLVEQKGAPDVGSTPEVKPSPETKSKKLNVDIGSILQNIKKKDEDLASARENASHELVMEVWKAYQEGLESPSLSSALSTAKINFDSSKIMVVVPNQITAGIIKAEDDLLEQLRQKTGIENLFYDFIIDIKQFPDIGETKFKEVVTEETVLNSMIEKKSYISEFIEKAGLTLIKGR